MEDVRKMAEDYAHNLLENNKINSEQWSIIVESILHGYKHAMSEICNLSRCDSVYLIPDYACNLIKKI
ncbi:hypothetical protein UFOVP410_56 [uncultured Caudovirales phage]|uniref:Uncharacterized protein n=1 Tax=uncultured Caudovirales phage TaxID=2100421 RepID=A0A6J5M6U0_9CAUD|nr:hypothetical protein UFOVP410_56 [uncultured Caudovirales phage]